MHLIYINELGKDYRGQRQYEFIFSENLVNQLDVRNPYILDLLVDEWFIVPSSGRALPPNISDIDMVGLLKNSELELELVQNSDYFGVIDAVEGIVALGWEAFDNQAEEYQYKRISFHFGEDLKSVTDKLSSKGYRLINEEIKYKLQ